MAKQKILGAKVRLKYDLRNGGGAGFKKGEIMTVYGSWRGLSLKASDGSCITRVPKTDVEFLKSEENV